MKRYGFISFSALLLLFSCSGNETNGSLSGTYVHPFDDELYKGSDTLEIELLSNGRYRIVNYGSFQSKTNGKQGREKELRMGVFNPTERILYVEKSGKLIAFDPQGRSVRIGNAVYQKVK